MTASPAVASPVVKDAPALLRVVGLTKRYGDQHALAEVSFDVNAGEVLGLIGPNGAGKTTFLDALSGFASCAGEVELAGEDISGLAPYKRVRAGLGRTFQQTQLYDDMSVAENVSVGAAGAGVRAPRPMEEVLVLLLDEPAGGLDTGESQWLGQRLRRIRDAGVTIMLIDHDMHLVLNLCDSIYVLDFGKVIAHGLPSMIRVDRTVAAAYLGETHAEAVTQ
jgi:ABC-type branched-subunit amino acid transport system ATPase component